MRFGIFVVGIFLEVIFLSCFTFANTNILNPGSPLGIIFIKRMSDSGGGSARPYFCEQYELESVSRFTKLDFSKNLFVSAPNPEIFDLTFPTILYFSACNSKECFPLSTMQARNEWSNTNFLPTSVIACAMARYEGITTIKVEVWEKHWASSPTQLGQVTLNILDVMRMPRLVKLNTHALLFFHAK